MVTMPFVVPIADPGTTAVLAGVLAGGGGREEAVAGRNLPKIRQPREPEPSTKNEKTDFTQSG